MQKPLTRIGLAAGLVCASLSAASVQAQSGQRVGYELGIRATSSTSSGPLGYELVVVGQVDDQLPKAPRTGDPVSGRELVVEAIDARGASLERQVVHDPTFSRIETFGADGSIAEGRSTLAEAATFLVSLPAPTHRVVLHRPVAEGDSYVLHRIDSATLTGDTSTSTATASLATAASTATFDTETVWGAGDGENRIDLVFLGDGYTADELAVFHEDVARFVEAFLDEPPFDAYADLFNIRRIDVISNESGIDHPSEGIERDTALDGTIECSEFEGRSYTLCINAEAKDRLLAAHLPPDARDVQMVLINDDIGRGVARGDYSIFQRDSVTTTGLHELGHNFGLADEYQSSGGRPCPNPGGSVYAPNLTTNVDRETTKWANWIAPETPVPTPGEYPTQLFYDNVIDGFEVGIYPGLYEGAGACPEGIYRPGKRTKMRMNTASFGPVNEEALVRSFFSYLSLAGKSTPASGPFLFGEQFLQSRQFAIEERSLPVRLDQVRWYLDDVWVGFGEQFTLDQSRVQQGTHELRATVRHLTDKVRHDPRRQLEEDRVWTVRGDDCTRPPVVVEGLTPHGVGETGFTLSWQPLPQATSYRVEYRHLATGAWVAAADTEETQFVFTDLSPASRQLVRVRGDNACGHGEFSAPLGVPLNLVCTPEAPAHLETTDVSTTSFTLRWSEARGAEGYAVQRYDWEAYEWRDVDSTDATHYTFTDLPPGSRQLARVRSLGSCDESTYNLFAMAILDETCPAPEAPVGVDTTNIRHNAFSVTWDPVADAESYVVRTYDRTIQQWVDLPQTDAAELTLTGLPSGSSHFVRVRAQSACGESDYHLFGYAALPDACAHPPAAPANLHTDSRRPSLLEWEATPGAERYVVQRWDVDAGAWIDFGWTLDASYDLSGLSPDTTHYARVRAVNGCGDSDYDWFLPVEL